MVELFVNGQAVSVPDGATILQACKEAGARVPTLCYLPKVSQPGACRICVVEIEGESRLAAACNTPVSAGMSVLTSTPRVISARRANMRMILSEHRSHCTSCKRNGTCSLQRLAAELGIVSSDLDPKYRRDAWDDSFPLIRDSSKCIKCMRCVAECSKMQHCAVWDFTGSGPHMKVCVRDGEPIASAGCTLCGQCVTHCPTGALSERDDVDRVLSALSDPNVLTVVQVAPAVRTSWGEDMGVSRDVATPGRLACALRNMGFDRVFDTDFAADLTIMEEANELLEWIGEGKARPMFTSCCPGWVRFAKLHHPELVSQLSSCKSPHQMLGAVVKNTMGGAAGDEDSGEIDGKRVFCLSIMPCMAKKYECDVPELSTDAGADVDAVLTVREFTRLMRMFGVDCAALDEEPFDNPLGLSTGAGTIFGRTGGVMEAALRTASFLATGKEAPLEACDTTEAAPDRPWVVKEMVLGDATLRIGVSSGLANVSQLLDALASGEESLDFVEIMACPGGCVGGGGQPIRHDLELAKPRAAVLNSLDAADGLRRSYENPDVQRLYDEHLGTPLSDLAEAWLHTDQQGWAI